MGVATCTAQTVPRTLVKDGDKDSTSKATTLESRRVTVKSSKEESESVSRSVVSDSL